MWKVQSEKEAHLSLHLREYKKEEQVYNMENKNTETSFRYTYSAREQEEIRKIRQKYQSPEENGMDRLR